jgi:hypothetical protein
MNTTATATRRQRKPRAKPARSISLRVKPRDHFTGVVRIKVGKEAAADYFLTELAADFGRGFKVEKVGLECKEDAYHVNIDGDNRTCDCKGFCRWSHCKHADGLAALIAAGQL